ncbi:peptidoglycan endopeptidase [Robertmurraya yapensis]|uniref:Peptidoglycan endopeptidase n=1 Tax=Bacillus yapensis TaxID=2492960 RepID=A0A431WCB9_9BACI|nr:peptidoglycan endopeptidase [Bacillus yapensis]RTR32948.1 peptidoglycan endopeptidase [Bacillus yapensis]TKS96771.1 LysM peptidoglycan-binding domain-containing protein [Bacillus yapensis]
MKKKVAILSTVALLSTSFATSAFASTYKVEKGDTLLHIAKKYQTSVTELKNLNDLSSDLIFVNQVLKVFNDTDLVKTSPQTTPVNNPVVNVSSYTVVKGDTLSKIAKQHNISLKNLMEWNNLDHHIIYPGQNLNVSNIQSPTPTQPVTKPEKNKQTENVSQTSTLIYVVQKGDTLSHISKRYGTSVKQLKELNNLSSDLIFIGQSLKATTTNTTIKEETKVVPKEEVTNTTPTSVINQSLVDASKKLLGIPYLWAGSTVKGFDCSGFIYYVYNQVGTKISRLSTDGYYSRSYYVDDPQVGDLVFFENTYRQGISHMGIYLGNNQFMHASSSKGVTISSLNEAYYKERFDGFKRFY